MEEINKAVNVSTGKANASALIKRDARFAIPRADIYETSEAFVVELDVPGTTKESMSITVHEGTLDIHAPVALPRQEGVEYLHREHDSDGFRRSFNLGDGVDQSRIDARYDSGVLVITLAKSERVKPREITIH
jgi:HSP20 family protein